MSYLSGLMLSLLLAQSTVGAGRGTGATAKTASGGGAVTYAANDTCDAANYSGSTATSTACTTGVATAGDAIVIIAMNGTFTTFTDSLGGTITQFTGFPYTWNTASTWQVYCMPNAAAGAHTITLSGSAPTPYQAMIVMGFHGASITSPCTPTTTAGTSTAVGTSTASAGPVTTTLASSAVVGIAQDLEANFTAGSGYTLVASPNAGFGAEYAIETTTGSYTPTFSLSSADTWVETAVVVHP